MKKISFLSFIIHFLLLIACMSSGADYAQVTQQWVSRYTGPINLGNGANSIAVDGSGNVYVTGYSTGRGTLYDYATIKYNSSGVQQWVSRYNGSGNKYDESKVIKVDVSGNVYITGLSFGKETGYDYTTIKYDSKGDTLWVRSYNGTGNYDDAAISFVVDDSGNVFVTGKSLGNGSKEDYATLKYSTSGVLEWTARYNGPGNDADRSVAIAADNAGNVYVTGNSVGEGTGSDFTTIKYNSNGETLWVKRYNGPGNGVDDATSIAVDGSGNVYVAGYSTGDNGYDYAVIKYDPEGNMLWLSGYNGPGNGNDNPYYLAIDPSGNIYAAGKSFGGSTGFDYALIKYSSNGDEIWVRRYNGPGNKDDVVHGIAFDASWNIYITGESFGTGTDYDYAAVKYNPGGDVLWVSRFDGPKNGDDVAHDICVDGSGNIYITGGSTGSGIGYDYATIKYSQP